MLTYQV